ncbi:MAG TPA: peptide deformylase [Candidatus Paceibacterota bacterium]|nr:peptide deformylase [Candidatus Paceibacterota bacterium]HPT17893.1 peptide deformylase [Candidatus Paceibacterota bacterium]
MKKILQKAENSQNVLREEAKAVPIRDITTPKIQKIIKEMSQALLSQNDGVAIAAPQIGYSLQIFVVSGKIFHENFIRGEATDNLPKEEIPEDLVFINPVISRLSREKIWVPEGCLSVRWLYGKTHRSKKVTVTAYDKNGKKFTRGASNLLAQIFQHETDHLKGILFTDHAKDVKEENPFQ